MKVSVIIPVYNVAPYVEECIRSVMNQTMTRGLECIIVDDCSQDNSMEIVERMVSEYDGEIEFRILHHDHNRGLSAARNTGIYVAKGEYIGFIDSDDWIEPTMYEDLVRIMDDNPKLQFISSPVIGDVEGGISSLYYARTQMYPKLSVCSIEEYLNLLLSFSIDSFAWNKLMRKGYVKELFPEGRNCEDYLFHYKNGKRLFGNKEVNVMFLNRHYYHYRQREDSIMHVGKASPDQWYIDFFYISIEIIEDCKYWNMKFKCLQTETLQMLFKQNFYKILHNHALLVKYRKLLISLKPYLKDMNIDDLESFAQRDIPFVLNIPFGFELLHYIKKIKGYII